MNSPLIVPMLCHVLLTGSLYALLTIARAPAVWGIGKTSFTKAAQIEKRISANLSNQFEWPLFFYIACVLVIASDSLYDTTYLWLSWVFIIGRILHSAVQIFTANIRLRGLIFTINFLAVIAMWLKLFVSYFQA